MVQKSSQAPAEAVADTSLIKNGTLPPSGFIYPVDGAPPAAAAPLVPAPVQYAPAAGGPSSGFFHTQPRMENLSAQGQAQWPRSSSSAADGRAGGGAADVFNGGDDLVIDEGTISLSGAYSDGSAPSTVFE